MTLRRVLWIIGACELVLAVVVGNEILSFAADPLPGIASALSDLMPSLDLAQWLD